MLKPGGLLVRQCSFVTKEEKVRLPKAVQKILELEAPWVFNDLYQDTVMAGFQKIESQIINTWSTGEENDSWLSCRMKELGVDLKFTEYVRVCTK